MARREALRELQARLAERLQAAHDDSRKATWLAVECAGRGLLFGLADAGEIFPAGVLRAVPRTQAWFLGVANLRGALHGVVDLAAFLGLRTPLVADSARAQAPLIALNPVMGAQCAVLVDRLAGLRRAEQLVLQEDASPGKPAFALARWRDEQGRHWQEIDLRALALHEQFLSISA
jgi:twitching motility protein PilI